MVVVESRDPVVDVEMIDELQSGLPGGHWEKELNFISSEQIS